MPQKAAPRRNYNNAASALRGPKRSQRPLMRGQTQWAITRRPSSGGGAPRGIGPWPRDICHRRQRPNR
eukprot:2914077-Pyramimonas_sp.AAC.2